MINLAAIEIKINMPGNTSLYNGHVHTPLGQQCGLLPCAQWQLLPSACGLGQQLLLGTGQQSTLLPSGGVNMATLLPFDCILFLVLVSIYFSMAAVGYFQLGSHASANIVESVCNGGVS